MPALVRMGTGERSPSCLRQWARSRRARWIHGRYSQEAKQARIEAAEMEEYRKSAKADLMKRIAPSLKRQEVLGRRMDRLLIKMRRDLVAIQSQTAALARKKR